MPTRIIPDSIRRDKRVTMLSTFEENVYFRLMLAVDDYGNIDAQPTFLRSMIFPNKHAEEKDIEAACGKLCAVGLARLYSVCENDYLHLEGFEDFQRLKHPRNVYPLPLLSEEKGDYRGMRW